MVAVIPMTAAPTHKIAIMEMTNIAVPGAAVIVTITAAPVGVGGHGRSRHQGGKSQYQADCPCHLHRRFLALRF
jgi:hypothetical protein